MKNIYMIGNTHFDPVWLWKWDEAMASIHSTFRSALDRMKEDKDFIYSFATPPVFEWIKKTDPQMFEEIKQRVDEGRWELCEGWWLQPDCYNASGESYARHALYGQKYLMDNFGRYADTVFNVDSFGHNGSTPQILKKSHVNYYCMTRPEKYHFNIESPYFNWKSKDGSVVRAFRTGQYSEIYNKDMEKCVEQTEEAMKDAPCDEMMLYGVTNHGGAPTKKAIADIHRLNEIKDYEIKFSTVSGYFKSQQEPQVLVDTEMITKDFGTYTNNHKIKKLNRIAEYAVLNAEKSAIIAKHILNKPYEKEKLTQCWRDIMFNQFHDILGGASTKDAYFDAYNQFGRAISNANEIMHFNLQAVTRKVKTPGKNPDNPWNIVVWNFNDIPYNGYIEAEIQWLHEFDAYNGGIVLEDDEGNKYPCQIILEKSVIPGFRSRFLFKATIPSMGYRCFKVIKTNTEEKIVNDNAVKTIETDAFTVFINTKTGILEKVFSKELNREFSNLLTPQCFEDEGDTWCFNVDSYGKKLEDFMLTDIKVTENGILRTTLKVTYSFRKSMLTMYYTFYNKEHYFDVNYSVNWNESHKVLKFVSDTGYSDVLVSSPFCCENREEFAGDIPMGEWIDMHDNNGGISFIADSLFSYTKKGTTLGLSVLRSCIYGDLRLGELDPDADYPIMEQGIAEGRLRVVIHKNDLYTDKIPQAATAFNNMPVVICEANHDGIFSSTDSFAKINSKSVLVSAVKESEIDTADIIRLYETGGIEQTVELCYFGNFFKVELAPYEIKTLKISGNKCEDVLITED